MVSSAERLPGVMCSAKPPYKSGAPASFKWFLLPFCWGLTAFVLSLASAKDTRQAVRWKRAHNRRMERWEWYFQFWMKAWPHLLTKCLQYCTYSFKVLKCDWEWHLLFSQNTLGIIENYSKTFLNQQDCEHFFSRFVNTFLLAPSFCIYFIWFHP